MTITPDDLRRDVVDEACQKAAQQRTVLFVYEYLDLFQKRVWAILDQNEGPHPDNTTLICTVSPNGTVDWRSPELRPSEKPFTVDRHWLMADQVTLSAFTPDQAITKALLLPLTPGTYLDDSLTCHL